MVNFRLYRLAFVPALLAVVVAMFSLEGAPDPLEPATPPTSFEGDRAAALARQIANAAPDRSPGSEGDAAIADLVAGRFDEIPSGAVTEQRFGTEIDGEQRTLRNVLLTLPGDADSTILIVAGRDTTAPPGAASSAAATGILVELANAFRISHTKTFVLASVSGSTAGAAGVRKLIDEFPEPDSIEAVVVISQPGASVPQRPFVVGSSTGTPSAPAQLVRTAERAIDVQAQASPGAGEGAFTQLARIAIPSGLGDQAPLIGGGTDAIAISSAGERPLAASDDTDTGVSPHTIDEFGRAVQSTVAAIDVADAAPAHGPTTYVELGDNLLPGWALAALALALILPAGVAAVDACARSLRAREALGPALAWAAARSLPFVGGLGVLYGLAAVGLVPRPPFPFDPGLYELGSRAAVTFGIVVMVVVASAWLLRARRITGARAPAPAACGLGAVSVAAAVALWIANPYLALLVVPAVHLWLPAAGERTPLRRAVLLLLALLCCVPLVAALAAVSHALALGTDAPWTLTLMVADGQIGFLSMLSLCFVAGAAVGALALVLSRRPKVALDEPPVLSESA